MQAMQTGFCWPLHIFSLLKRLFQMSDTPLNIKVLAKILFLVIPYRKWITGKKSLF